MVLELLKEPDLGFLLYRLVGGSVFTDPEGVVGPDVDNGFLHQGGDTDGGLHVVREDEEGAAGGNYAAVKGEAGKNGSHSEFGYAGLEEGAAEITLGESGGSFQESVGLVRVGKIGGGNNHVIQLAGQPAENGGGGGPGSHTGLLLHLGEIEPGELAGSPIGQLCSVCGMSGGPLGPGGLLRGGVFLLALDDVGHKVCHSREIGEGIVGISTQISDGSGEVGTGSAQWLTVGGDLALEGGAFSIDGALAHDGFTDDDCRLVLLGDCGIESGPESGQISAVDFQYIPTPGAVLGGGVFGSNIIGDCGELDVVGVVEHHQVVQSQLAGDTAGTLGNFLLDAAIGDESEVIMSHPVTEPACEELVGDGRTDGEYMALAQRAGGVFNAPGWIHFGMSGSGAAPLAEALHLILTVKAVQTQGGVEHGGHVTGIQEKTVAFEPGGIGGVEVQIFGVKQVDELGTAHGAAGVAGFCPFHHGSGKDANLIRGRFESLVVHFGFLIN